MHAEPNDTKKRRAAWTFDPAALTITVGGNILATNNDGEVHRFTEVDDFGGGVVQSLNDASGNSVAAPECKDILAPTGT